ncbi:MAG: serine/threonine protein kinase [Proteobacteria bacterium]|nr:serine/threonine protein kinase [Pseudomonadota bacterium]MCP4920365.1 serine/threonine protein kinase [Pseudomonadota bacterium]
MQRVGPYELEERIGAGGMADVWRARHVQWRVPVVLKVLRAELGGPDAAALRHEVCLVASLSHPGIVRVLDQGTVPQDSPLPAGAPFLVMELLTGGTLLDEVGRITWPRLRWILLRLLDALAHSHAHGVIHRDLKPSNVLRDAGGTRVVLSDVGIGGLLDEADDDQIKGTPAYMAPEQLLGSWREQGPWTDQYTLGAMAWTLATGRRPFGCGDEAMQGHVQRAPGAFVPIRPCPPGFEGWLRRLLKKPTGTDSSARPRRRQHSAPSTRRPTPRRRCRTVWGSCPRSRRR